MKQKQTGHGITAIVLALVLIAGILPIAAVAEGELGTIASFDVSQTDIAIETGVEIADIGLPAELAATMEGGESANIPVTWDDGGLYDKDTAGIYTFSAIIPAGYTYGGTSPVAVVTVGDTTSPQEDPPQANNSDITINLAWLPAESDGTVTGDALLNDTNGATDTWTDYDATNTLKYKLTVDGTYNNAPVGSIEIRIPQTLFQTRTGEDQTFTTNLPLKPATGGTTDFHYYIDEAADEIVITNYAVLNGAVQLLAELSADYAPHNTVSGSEKQIQATFSDGAQTVTSNTLTATMTSAVAIDTLTSSWNSGGDVYTTWQDSWGEAPADAGDYIYLKWNLNFAVKGAEDYAARVVVTPHAGEQVAVWGENILQVAGGPTVAWHLESDEPLADNDIRTLHGTGYLPYRRTALVITRRAKPAEGQSIYTNISATVTVRGVDNNDQTAKSVTSSIRYYTYKIYAGDIDNSSRDYGIANPSDYIGGINKLLAGSEVQLSAWRSRSDGRYFSLTKDENEEYGVYDYTVTSDEGSNGVGFAKTPNPTSTSVVNFNMLTPGTDYVISGLIPGYNNGRGYQVTAGGEYKAASSPDTASVFEFYTTDTSNVETKFGEFKYLTVADDGVAKDDWYFIDEATGTRSLRGDPFTLPDNTIDVRMSVTSKNYEMEFYYELVVTIRPTDRVKQILNDYLTAYPDAQYIDMISYGNFTVTDHTGATKFSKLNNYVAHYSQPYAQLTKYDVVEHNEKELLGYGVDLQNEALLLQATSYYTMDAATEMSAAELESLGVPNQTEGTFYELLPAGTSIDRSSVDVFDSQGISSTDYRYSLTIQENYADTGRTMVTIRVWDTTGNHYTSSRESRPGYTLNWYANASGWSVTYIIVSPLGNLVDNGRLFRTHGAYTSPTRIPNADNNFPNGYVEKDSGWYGELAGLDVNGDGTGDTDSDMFHFASADYTSTALINLQSGASKSASSQLSLGYLSEVETYASGEYSYRLRFANKEGVKAKGIVFYDVLEEAYEANEHWKGTLEDINYANATAAGIDVTVYYSTQSGLDPKNNAAHADLTDTAIWSATQPADMSTVTAVAFDCTTATGGGNFVLGAEKSFYITLLMKAPRYTAENAGLMAYNTGYLTAQIAPDSGEAWTEFKQETNLVSVGLGTPEGTIEKSASPQSGTEAEPTEVTPGDVLTYKLTISNTQAGGSWDTAEVIDNLPSPLIVADVKQVDIRYSYASDPGTKYSITEGGNLALTASGSQLKFTVKNLDAAQSMIIEIPVTVPDISATLANSATLTEIGGFAVDVVSGTTYHKIQSSNVTAKLTKTVVDAPEGDSTVFNYTVTVKDADDNQRTGLSYTGRGGKADGTIPADGAVTLSNGQSILISGVVVGDKISVSEAFTPQYSASYTIDGGAVQNAAAFTDSVIGDNGMEIVYTNTYTPAVNFSVTKTVTGDYADLTQEFDFTVTVMQNDGTTPFGAAQLTYEGTGGKADGTIALTDGTGEFSLKHGQGITITDMPSDAKVTVTEDSLSSLWTTTHAIDGVAHAGGATTGQIDAANTTFDKTVAYTNTFSQTPTGLSTGSSKLLPIVIASALAVGIALLFMVLRVKKTQRRPRH